MYNNYLINSGWVCPKCGRVYSPSQSYCMYCNDHRIRYSTTTATPEWIYKEDPNKGTATPNNWWKDYVTLSTANDLSNLNINWRDIISNYSTEEE